MFTVEQIKQAHRNVKSGADFPAYIQKIKNVGVTHYEAYVTDGRIDYHGANDYTAKVPATYDVRIIADTANRESFKAGLIAHQQGKTDFPSFINMCARFGIDKWAICMDNMTCTYYDKAGNEILVEKIPHSLEPQPSPIQQIKQAFQSEWHDEAILIPITQGEQFESHGNRLKVIVPTAVTNDQYGLYDIEMEPQARGPKLHYHTQMDETFIVREGTLTMLTAKGEANVEAGTVIQIPRLCAHGYNNDTGNPVKMTMVFTPGLNREDFFKNLYQLLDERPANLDAFKQLYRENDSYPLNINDMVPMHQNR